MAIELIGNRAQLAKALGISSRRLEALFTEGILERPGSKTFCLLGYISAFIDYKTGRKEDLDLTVERAKLAKEQRKKTRLERLEKQKRLIDRDEVIETVGRLLGNVRARLLSVPSKLAPIVAVIDSAVEAESEIKAQINGALEGLSVEPFERITAEADEKGS